ncbi:hypothetical protein BY996DRAFT_6576160 [Phakopsora pachyrhizi]|nr:hypothetical protein BY996DRAFT_6576160 [Phakopsora pachyrhizi]
MRAKYPIVLGQMEEISAKAKLLIGLCLRNLFLGRRAQAIDLSDLYDKYLTDCVWRHCDQIGWKVRGRRMNKVYLVIDGWSEAVERETMTKWEEGPDEGSRYAQALALGCLIDCQPRRMAELRIQMAGKIINDSVKSVIVRGDRGNRGNPELVPRRSGESLEELAEEEGEENHRLDNAFNAW